MKSKNKVIPKFSHAHKMGGEGRTGMPLPHVKQAPLGSLPPVRLSDSLPLSASGGIITSRKPRIQARNLIFDINKSQKRKGSIFRELEDRG